MSFGCDVFVGEMKWSFEFALKQMDALQSEGVENKMMLSAKVCGKRNSFK
jgi:hypothetical protein